MTEPVLEKAEEFIEWMIEMTDFGEWDRSIQAEVHRKLIAILISEPEPIQMKLPFEE